jgi:hypothetical protein
LGKDQNVDDLKLCQAVSSCALCWCVLSIRLKIFNLLGDGLDHLSVVQFRSLVMTVRGQWPNRRLFGGVSNADFGSASTAIGQQLMMSPAGKG